MELLATKLIPLFVCLISASDTLSEPVSLDQIKLLCCQVLGEINYYIIKNSNVAYITKLVLKVKQAIMCY